MQKNCLTRNLSPRRIIAALTLFLSSGLLALLGFATPSTPTPYSRPGVTVMMLAANAGSTKSNSPVAVSADGRYVAFSGAFPFGCCVVGIYDRQTGLTDTPAGSTWDATLALSTDGRFVAFNTNGSYNDNDNDNSEDVYRLDRQTGAFDRVSAALGGGQPTCAGPGGCVFSSWYPAMSADGRYVAFHSFATNLTTGDTRTTNIPDVFVRDVQSGVTEKVSVANDGTQGNNSSVDPSISADGRYVAFESFANNLVSGNTNTGTCSGGAGTSTTPEDIYLRDRQAHTTELVSVGMSGTQDGCSWQPSISADGRYVAFVSAATNLIPSDSNSAWDVYVRDRLTGRTERVSVTSDGAQGTCAPSSCRCGAPSISADGRYVSFHSFQSLVSDDVNQTGDIYVHDRETGSTERVSLAYPGQQVPGEPPGNANSTSGPDAHKGPAISADGRIVTFDSFAADLVQNDNWNNPTKAYTDVFFRDRGSAVGIGALNAACNANPATASGWATFSGAKISAADDPPNDAAPGAANLGAELTGASLAYRPERADLFVRFDVASLPAAVGGVPGVVYGVQFTISDLKYEVRATAADMTSPYFAVYNCAGSPCYKVATLAGAMGTAGNEVSVSIPISVLAADYPSGVYEGAPLTALRAYTALGTATSGPGETLDDVVLPSTAIPTRSVNVGVAPSGIPEAQVAINTPATVTNGNFSGNLPPVSAGSYKVWAKACLDDVCGSAVSTPLTVTDACAAPPVQLTAVVSRKTHGSAGTFDINLPLTGSPGIECRSGDVTLVYTFAAPVTNCGSATQGTVSSGPESNQCTVTLTGLTNAQYYQVGLNGVVDSGGGAGNVPGPQWGLLIGDVNGSGVVTSGDTNLCKAQALQPITIDNFRDDVNASGAITTGDVNLIKQHALDQL